MADFKYLGSTLADSGGLEAELRRRKALAIAKFAELRLIWDHKLVSVQTKMKFYRAFIPPTLLYGCEAWATTLEQERQLNVVHMRFLRSILGVAIWDRQLNTVIASRCGIQQVPELLSLARTRWAGHLIRMGDNRLPKKVLFGALADEGKRCRGKPKQRLAETYRKDFHTLAVANSFDISSFTNGLDSSRRATRGSRGKVFGSWWTSAADKNNWRACIDSAWPRKPSAP